MSAWLTLQEYSNEQNVSISTLRRKIKEKSIEYTFKRGKYFLKSPKETKELSFKEQKNYYKTLLEEKDKEINKLKENCEGLIQLLEALEKEKSQMIAHLQNNL